MMGASCRQMPRQEAAPNRVSGCQGAMPRALRPHAAYREGELQPPPTCARATAAGRRTVVPRAGDCCRSAHALQAQPRARLAAAGGPAVVSQLTERCEALPASQPTVRPRWGGGVRQLNILHVPPLCKWIDHRTFPHQS